MDQDHAFVDYYQLLQIGSNAEPEIVQAVFRLLTERFDPDTPEAGDLDRLVLLNEAYRILSDPATRAAYDATYQARQPGPLDTSTLPGSFNPREFASSLAAENDLRLGLLCLLYARRRASDEHPGHSMLEFQTLLSVSRENLLFTIWYLAQKEFIRRGDESDYSITAAGVEFVERHFSNDTVPAVR